MPIAEDPEPRPADAPADDPFANLVLDEEFVKDATVKEASGRARFLTAKWKRQPLPEPEQWRPPVTEIRRSRFGRRARRVDAWGNPVKHRELNWQAPLFVALAAAVTLAALNVDRLRDWYHSGDVDSAAASAPVAAPTTQAPETAAPTAAPPTTDPSTPTAAHPWAGSPAETWPAGADAIQLPDAKAVGVFGADEVAAQLKSVKDFLVLAEIDPRTLAGDTPQDALKLLDRQARADVNSALTNPSKDHNATDFFSRFDPGFSIPVTSEVKIMGRMSFESDGEQGVLVHTDYTFVYALRPGPKVGKTAPPGTGSTANAIAWTDGSGDSPDVEREIVRRQIDFRFYNPAHYTVDPGKLVLVKWDNDFSNNVCGTLASGFLVTDFPATVPDTGAPHTGPTVDPYDRSKSLGDRPGGCGTVSRT